MAQAGTFYSFSQCIDDTRGGGWRRRDPGWKSRFRRTICAAINWRAVSAMCRSLLVKTITRVSNSII